MMRLIATVAACLALTFAVTALTPDATAQQDGPVQSLRGPEGLDETKEAPDVTSLETGRRFEKAYRQQPPMVPHKVEGYQINLKVNQCMRCHDWPYNVEERAPKISETHYVDRNGVALDKVTASRWFCTQCHVPQANAPALVRNKFESAVGGR